MATAPDENDLRLDFKPTCKKNQNQFSYNRYLEGIKKIVNVGRQPA
jgi:hypothetical protein